MKGQFRLPLLKMLSAKETSSMKSVGGSEFWRVLGTLTLLENGKERRAGFLFGWFCFVFFLSLLMQHEKVRTGSKPD